MTTKGVNDCYANTKMSTPFRFASIHSIDMIYMYIDNIMFENTVLNV